MRYYSDKTKELYDDLKTLKSEEEAFDKAEAAKAAEKDANEAKRDALYDDYLKAVSEFELAEKALEDARNEASKISKEYIETLDKILKPAESAFNSCRDRKIEAYKAYRNHVKGPHTGIIDAIFDFPFIF